MLRQAMFRLRLQGHRRYDIVGALSSMGVFDMDADRSDLVDSFKFHGSSSMHLTTDAQALVLANITDH